MFEFPDERHVVTYYVIHFEPLYPNNGFFISKFLGAYAVVRFPRGTAHWKVPWGFCCRKVPQANSFARYEVWAKKRDSLRFDQSMFKSLLFFPNPNMGLMRSVAPSRRVCFLIIQTWVLKRINWKMCGITSGARGSNMPSNLSGYRLNCS